ncbi:MAG: phosphoglucosamine mutase [Methanobacteriota archaeon]
MTESNAPRLFGTNGIRGRVGDTLTAELALRIGASAGTFWKRGTVAIGTDCRESGLMLSMALASGLNSAGLDVTDLGIVPTPALQYHVRTRGLAGGIVVTASHNPPEFNGLKCVSPDGTEMSRTEEEEIERIHFAGKFIQADWQGIGQLVHDEAANASYIDGVAAAIAPNKPVGIDVVVDCGNGASGFTTPRALRSIGCRLQTINAQPDGSFPGRPSEPTEENLSELIALCKSGGFDLGAAHDGDADRVVFVDEKGGFVSGDAELGLMAQLACRRTKRGKVVVPIDTSRAVQEAVEGEGGELIYTKVGSPGIARKMREISSVLGGEANGGIIFPQFQYCRDGLFAAAFLARELAEGGEPLSKLVSRLPKRQMRRWKLPCPFERFEEVLAKLQKEYPDAKRFDGLLVESKDHWVLFRPSGTEPILRLTVESKSDSALSGLFEKYSGSLKAAVEGARGR